MKTYTYSNWKSCKTCGFSNRYFYTQNTTNGKRKTWVSKECKECYLERIRKYNAKYQKSEKYLEYQKEYRETHVDLTRDLRRKKHRFNARNARILEKNKKLMALNGFKFE